MREQEEDPRGQNSGRTAAPVPDLEPNCLLLHVRSIFNPVSTWWPENCSPQISDHVCHMSASRLTHVNERARTMRLSALSSARAKRSTENLSRFYVLTTSRYSLSCVRPAAAPHSCSTKRSKPFKEATELGKIVAETSVHDCISSWASGAFPTWSAVASTTPAH